MQLMPLSSANIINIVNIQSLATLTLTHDRAATFSKKARRSTFKLSNHIQLKAASKLREIPKRQMLSGDL